MSPVAFICWILPGTEKIFKQWQDLLIKVLLMYPLIIALIAGGRLVGTMVSNGAGGAFGATGDSLIGLIANFAPYFLIPATFKFAGKFIASVTQSISKNASKIKGDARDPNSWLFRRQEYAAEKRDEARAEFVPHAANMKTGFNPKKLLDKGVARGYARFSGEPLTLMMARNWEHVKKRGDIRAAGDDGSLGAHIAIRGDGTSHHSVTGELMEEGKYYHPLYGGVMDHDSMAMASKERDSHEWLRYSTGYWLGKADTVEQRDSVMRAFHTRASEMGIDPHHAKILLNQIGDDHKFENRSYRYMHSYEKGVNDVMETTYQSRLDPSDPTGGNFTAQDSYRMSMMRGDSLEKMVLDTEKKEGFGSTGAIASSKPAFWSDLRSGAMQTVEHMRLMQLAGSGDLPALDYARAQGISDYEGEFYKSKKQLTILDRFETNLIADIANKIPEVATSAGGAPAPVPGAAPTGTPVPGAAGMSRGPYITRDKIAALGYDRVQQGVILSNGNTGASIVARSLAEHMDAIRGDTSFRDATGTATNALNANFR